MIQNFKNKILLYFFFIQNKRCTQMIKLLFYTYLKKKKSPIQRKRIYRLKLKICVNKIDKLHLPKEE